MMVLGEIGKSNRFVMSQALDHDSTARAIDAPDRKHGNLLAAGSIFGALIASTCCIAPLVLVMLGVSGAWIGSLTALAPYKSYFLTVTGILVAAGFWQVYYKPKQACEDSALCARPASGRIIRSVLWIATVLALLSATVDLWAPLFY